MKKKKSIIFLIILVIIVLIGLIIYFKIQDTKSLKYNPEQAEIINLSQLIKNLEDCQGNVPSSYCAYDISDSNLEKLKAIENINGNLICRFNDRDIDNECHVIDYITQNSETIWRFEWKEIGARENYNYLFLSKEGENYFFVRAANIGIGTPYSGSLYIIEMLDSEIINKLILN